MRSIPIKTNRSLEYTIKTSNGIHIIKTWPHEYAYYILNQTKKGLLKSVISFKVVHYMTLKSYNTYLWASRASVQLFVYQDISRQPNLNNSSDINLWKNNTP